MPVIEDASIAIGEAWLPPVANDSGVHALEDVAGDADLLALQFARPDGEGVLGAYLAAKAEVIRQAAGAAPRARADMPREPTRDWFAAERAAACREAGEASDSHADLPVELPALPRATRAFVQGGTGGASEATLAHIRRAAASDAINAASLARVVAALKARGIPIRCADIDDGAPRVFGWAAEAGRFVPVVGAPGPGPSLRLLGPSKGLIKRHWDRLPVGSYRAMAVTADLPIRGITPSNELSYVLVFRHAGQGILVCGDAGCVDFKPDGSDAYHGALLAELGQLNVVQVAHHAGRNAHFYRVLEAAGIVGQAPAADFLLSHAVDDRHRPSDVFARFMEHLSARPADRLFFTSRPQEPKVRDYRARIAAAVDAPADKGDVRIAFGDARWDVLKHAVAVEGPAGRRSLTRGALQPSAASQREQTPGWAWVPTSGRIFQQRAHFSPSARWGTTATPGTSSSAKAPAGAGSAARVTSEVMQTSAKSTEARAARSAASARWTAGAASRLAPMRFSRRSISSAPVTTRRTRRIASHLAARRASCQSRGVAGKSSRCTELSSPGKRVSQTSSMVKGSIGASQVTRRWKRASSTVRAARRRGLVAASQ